MNRHSIRLVVVFMCLVPVATAGCTAGKDFQFRVQNETDRAWLMRVVIGGAYGDQVGVARVGAGQSGVAFAWYGESDRQIELLEGNCDVVGVFAEAAPGVYTVEGVDSLSGIIEAVPPGVETFPSGPPDIEPVESCGGLVLR